MYIALKTFFGMKVSMTKGQVKEISDKEAIKDLLEAGYIEEVKPEKAATEKVEKKSKRNK